MENLINLTQSFVQVPKPAEGEDFPMIDENITKLKLVKIKTELASVHKQSSSKEEAQVNFINNLSDHLFAQ